MNFERGTGQPSGPFVVLISQGKSCGIKCLSIGQAGSGEGGFSSPCPSYLLEAGNRLLTFLKKCFSFCQIFCFAFHCLVYVQLPVPALVKNYMSAPCTRAPNLTAGSCATVIHSVLKVLRMPSCTSLISSAAWFSSWHLKACR